MFCDAIIGMMESACETWNTIVSMVMGYLSMTPETYNAAAWNLITYTLNPIFVSVGASLVVVFFLIGFCEETIDVKSEMRIETMLRMFIKLGVAEFFVINNLSIVRNIYQFSSEFVKFIAGRTSSGIATLSLGDNLTIALDNLGFGGQVIMLLISFIFYIVAFAAAIALLYQAMTRIFKVLAIIPFGSLAFATIAGNRTVSASTVSFVKFTIGTSLEALMMMISLILCAVISKSGGLGLANALCGSITDYTDAGVDYCLPAALDLMFTILLTLGIVKGSSSLVSKALSLNA